MSTSSTPRRILFVTGNANKLKEVRSILLASSTGAGAAPFEVDSQDLDVPEVQGTTQEVATAKVKAAAEIVNGPCITEVRPDCVYPENGNVMSRCAAKTDRVHPFACWMHRTLLSALRLSAVCPDRTSNTS